MTNDRETADSSAEPYKPYQFTVRTFFAAAIWLSLLFAAINTLEEGALGTAVLLLAWVAFAELYRRLGATRAMVALCGGPVVLLVLWCIILIGTQATQSPWVGDRELPAVGWFFFFALGWGIALSVVVVIERGVDRWAFGEGRRRRDADPGGRSDDPPPLRASSRYRCAAVLFSIHTVLTVVAAACAAGTSLGPGRRPTPLGFVGFWVVTVVDLPVVPLYILMPGSESGGIHEMGDLAATSLVFGGALYAAVGLFLGAVAERFRRQAPLSSPASDTSSEDPSTHDEKKR